MKAIFVGRKKPYPHKNGVTYFKAFFDVRDANGFSSVAEYETNAQVDAKLVSAEPGTELDLDVQPHMFNGKVDRLSVVAING